MVESEVWFSRLLRDSRAHGTGTLPLEIGNGGLFSEPSLAGLSGVETVETIILTLAEIRRIELRKHSHKGYPLDGVFGSTMASPLTEIGLLPNRMCSSPKV